MGKFSSIRRLDGYVCSSTAEYGIISYCGGSYDDRDGDD